MEQKSGRDIPVKGQFALGVVVRLSLVAEELLSITGLTYLGLSVTHGMSQCLYGI